jgi:16S rRNA (uracil1498-N3)-methyltransferase
MAVRSVYLADVSVADNRIRIGGEAHRHLAVARIEPGETVEVFDGRGGVWVAAVESAGKRETIVKVTDSRKVERDPVEIVLGLAMIKVPAFELALEKAVEVGVARVIPFTANRSNVAAGNRHDRWHRILVEAVKQSKHYFVPVLDGLKTFDEIVSVPAASKIIFAERRPGPLKPALSGAPVLYLVGPEGGWTDQELLAADAAGFKAVSLGRATLKAETAAIVGAALIRYEMEN